MQANLKKWLPIAAMAGFAASAQALPTALTFDGYCDGLTGVSQAGPQVFTAVWNLDACPDNASTTAAGLHGKVGGVAGVTGTYDVVTQGLGVPVLVVRINENNTWAYYTTDGSLFNFGTWTEGAPAAAAVGGRPASFQR